MCVGSQKCVMTHSSSARITCAPQSIKQSTTEIRAPHAIMKVQYELINSHSPSKPVLTFRDLFARHSELATLHCY